MKKNCNHCRYYINGLCENRKVKWDLKNGYIERKANDGCAYWKKIIDN